MLWSPQGEGDERHYIVPITIKPLTTERVTVKLGLQLPPGDFLEFPHGKATWHQRWGWQHVGAKGFRAR